MNRFCFICISLFATFACRSLEKKVDLFSEYDFSKFYGDTISYVSGHRGCYMVSDEDSYYLLVSSTDKIIRINPLGRRKDIEERYNEYMNADAQQIHKLWRAYIDSLDVDVQHLTELWNIVHHLKLYVLAIDEYGNAYIEFKHFCSYCRVYYIKDLNRVKLLLGDNIKNLVRIKEDFYLYPYDSHDTRNERFNCQPAFP